MTPGEQALARARTYGFVSEVLLVGWTDRARAVASELAWLPELPADPDQAAARHHRVFGRGVPPYESVFCSPEGLLGGDEADAVRRAYTQAGFHHGRTDIEPDHAGLQAAALSWLCAAEADAHRDGVPTGSLHHMAKNLASQHLGRWVTPLRIAVDRQGVPELTAVVQLLEDLVRDHAGEAAPPEASSPPEDVLADPKTGLKAVARYLLVPARCGMWLGQADLQRLAAEAGLACGFGRRVQMLESLLFSAVDHEELATLCEVLRAELGHWDADDPRVQATDTLLQRLAEAAPTAT